MIESQVQNAIVLQCTRLGIWCFRVCAEAKRGHTPGAPKGTFDLYEGQAGPEELITRTVKIAVRWRSEDLSRGSACPVWRCPMEDA